jgi:hypothetical protein
MISYYGIQNQLLGTKIGVLIFIWNIFGKDKMLLLFQNEPLLHGTLPLLVPVGKP